MKLLISGGLAAGALSALIPTIVIAAERTADEVIVTAARIEEPMSEVIGSVSVITREDIDRRLVQSTQDLLRGETGLNVVNNGGLGKLSNVFLRGADSEQVLVLVDGVRVGSATAGTTAFEFLPVDQIERIEIVRGPRSSLYGADAIGGVIQIFTRKAQGFSASAGAGSHDTFDATAALGHRSENAWFSVSGGYLETEGYNSCRGAPFPPGGGCFTIEPDDDGYDRTSGSARAGLAFGERGEIEASALYASGVTEYDGDFANVTDYTQRVITLRGRVAPTERWTLSALAGAARDDQRNRYDDPFTDAPHVFAGRFETERRNASVQSDFALAQGRSLTLGVDWLEDRVASTTAYEAAARDNIGVFTQLDLELDGHRLLLSARHDDNEQFGGYTTGNFGWRYALTPDLTLTAAWGRAFGAPTFNDLYFPGASNPNLDPEKANSYELGLQGVRGALRWSLAAYENRIEDLIVFDSAISAPDNLNRARIRGLEAEASLALGEWSIGFGYSAMDPRNRTPGEHNGAFLPRRARHSGRIDLGRSFGRLDLRLRVLAESARYDDLANARRVGGYAIVDLTADYAVNDAWSLHARIGNALDRDYQTVRLYDQDDRTVYFGLRYRQR